MSVLSGLRAYLDLDAARVACAAANIANAETPGYRRFEAFLRPAHERLDLIRTRPGHLEPPGEVSRVRVVQDSSTVWRADGNNVDPDAELVKLLEAVLRYQSVLRMASGQLSLCRLVATEGRR